jgi:hypothetical protein
MKSYTIHYIDGGKIKKHPVSAKSLSDANKDFKKANPKLRILKTVLDD